MEEEMVKTQFRCNAPDGYICNVNDDGICKLPTYCSYKQAYAKCPECLQQCSQDELDTFGGLCEECKSN